MVDLLHILTPKGFAYFVWASLILLLEVSGFVILEGGYGFFIGTAIGIICVGFVFNHFVLSGEMLHNILVMNLLKKDDNGESELRRLQSGLNWKYPWEKISEISSVSLKSMRAVFSESIAAIDTVVQVKVSILYTPDPKNLIAYLVHKNQVESQLKDGISEFLSSMAAKKKARVVRKQMMILANKLELYFSSKNSDEKPETAKRNLEKILGIKIHQVVLSDIDFDEDYQKTLTTKARATILQEAAEKMAKSEKNPNGLPIDEALDNILNLEGTASKSIFKIEGEGADAAATLFMSIFQGALDPSGKGGKK